MNEDNFTEEISESKLKESGEMLNSMFSRSEELMKRAEEDRKIRYYHNFKNKRSSIVKELIELDKKLETQEASEYLSKELPKETNDEIHDAKYNKLLSIIEDAGNRLNTAISDAQDILNKTE